MPTGVVPVIGVAAAVGLGALVFLSARGDDSAQLASAPPTSTQFHPITATTDAAVAGSAATTPDATTAMTATTDPSTSTAATVATTEAAVATTEAATTTEAPATTEAAVATTAAATTDAPTTTERATTTTPTTTLPATTEAPTTTAATPTTETAAATTPAPSSAPTTVPPTTVPPSTMPASTLPASTIAATTIPATTLPPTTVPAPYATLPDGSPEPVVARFDVDTITITGVVPTPADVELLANLALANSKTPATVDNQLTVNPAVPRDVGVRVVELTSTRFPEGSAEVVPEYAAELDRVANVMNLLPHVSVTVVGHADQRGDELRNYRLSGDRAAAVVDYLVGAGISPARLSSRAVGEADLLTLADDDAALALNRRTEFIFYGLLQPG